MALLLRARDGERFVLGSPTLVGRDDACDLVLADGRVSQHHGRIAHEAGRWSFEDLSSRNGSSINGRPCTPNPPQPLAEGDVIVVGTADESWTVHTLGAPPLLARSARGAAVTGTAYLGIPSAEEPVATVYAQATGRWVVEMAGGVRPVEHREQLVVAGTAWRLFLPGNQARTLEDQDRPVGLEELSLHFAVSADEETVSLTLEQGARRIPVKARTHHYLLLTLARERLADAARGEVPPAEQGWVYQDELCRMLGLEANVVYLQVHRARRQLEAAGIVRAFDLVERRSGSGQVRIGVAQLTVSRLADTP